MKKFTLESVFDKEIAPRLADYKVENKKIYLDKAKSGSKEKLVEDIMKYWEEYVTHFTNEEIKKTISGLKTKYPVYTYKLGKQETIQAYSGEDLKFTIALLHSMIDNSRSMELEGADRINVVAYTLPHVAYTEVYEWDVTKINAAVRELQYESPAANVDKQTKKDILDRVDDLENSLDYDVFNPKFLEVIEKHKDDLENLPDSKLLKLLKLDFKVGSERKQIGMSPEQTQNFVEEFTKALNLPNPYKDLENFR